MILLMKMMILLLKMMICDTAEVILQSRHGQGVLAGQHEYLGASFSNANNNHSHSNAEVILVHAKRARF